MAQECGSLRSLSFLATPLSFPNTQYLMSYLVDHPLEELVLENNGLHSAGIAGIVRALQVLELPPMQA